MNHVDLTSGLQSLRHEMVKLEAGIADILRGEGQPARPLTAVRVGDVTLDPLRRRVTARGAEVHLPPKEFAMLQLLTSAPGTVITRRELLVQVWDITQPGVYTRCVDAAVFRLRRALGAASRLETVHGVGLRWAVPSPAQESGNACQPHES